MGLMMYKYTGIIIVLYHVLKINAYIKLHMEIFPLDSCPAAGLYSDSVK